MSFYVNPYWKIGEGKFPFMYTFCIISKKELIHKNQGLKPHKKFQHMLVKELQKLQTKWKLI